MPNDHTVTQLRFGRFELQPQERRLLDDGRPVALGARAFDLLMVLVERAGQLVTKHELLERVWPGLVVEENNLQVQVSTLRKALGPDAVTTIPGRGYRFALNLDDGNVVAHLGPAASAGATSAADAAHSAAAARTNLPARLPPLIGRAADIEAVKGLLLQHAVVTIVGAGGIGKTRLAQTVAAEAAAMVGTEFPDGVWWVELAALSDGALVPAEVARALGVQVGGARGATNAVCALMATRRLLLVLDNCEHLTDAVADFIDAVCASAPGVRLLVTSQEPVKTADEHAYRLSALAVPSASATAQGASFGAVELFVARAHAIDPRFELSAAHLPAIIEICRRLDGIPLAIEFAAARLPLLGIEGLRARLDERFNVLTAGSRVVLRRHQTLRATLEWSHGLLTDDERTVLRRLGVFAGSFTLEAAQDVAQDERITQWAALDHLGALVDKSLVQAEGEPVPRYRLLETMRAFALERLADAGETQAILRRHAEALNRLLSRYDIADLRWRTKPANHAALAAEVDNLRAALAWAATADASNLAVTLASVSQRVWVFAFQLIEGLERCLTLRSTLADDDSTPVAARFWLTIAKLGQYTRRHECYDAALRAAAMFREQGDDSWLYDALVCAAALGQPFGYVAEIERALDEAARIERPEWPPRQRAAFQLALYRLRVLQDRKEEALASALRQAALYREEGSYVGEQFAISNVVGAETELGHPEAALEHARAAIARLDAISMGVAAGHLHDGAIVAATVLGRLDEAMAHGRTAYELLKHEGDEFRALESLVLPVALSGRLADAATLMGFLDALHRRTGEVMRVGQARYRARATALVDAGLGANDLGRCRALGTTLTGEQAFRIACGKLA